MYETTITVSADTLEDTVKHLRKITARIAKESTLQMINKTHIQELKFEDNNCYGVHCCKIEFE